MIRPKTVRKYMHQDFETMYGYGWARYVEQREIDKMCQAYKATGYKFPQLRNMAKQVIQEKKLEELLDGTGHN